MMDTKKGGGMGAMFDDLIVKYHHEKMPILEQADKIGVSVDFLKKRRRALELSTPTKRGVK